MSCFLCTCTRSTCIYLFQANSVIDMIGFPEYILNKTRLNNEYKNVSIPLFVSIYNQALYAPTLLGTFSVLWGFIRKKITKELPNKCPLVGMSV